MGCSVVHVRECGIHLCWGCGMKAKFKRDKVNSKRNKRLKFEEAKATEPAATAAAEVKRAKKIAHLKHKYEKFNSFALFEIYGGVFKGESLGLRVQQGGKRMDLQPIDCELPYTVEMMWHKTNEKRVLTTYTKGEGGAKKSNGCDKANRSRINNQVSAFKEMGDVFAQMDREDEEERIAMERRDYDRREAKNNWIGVQVQQFERDWLRTKGATYARTVSLQDRLEDCFKTEFDHAYASFKKDERKFYTNRLWRAVNSFATIESYLAKQVENAKDVSKYGKVIDSDKIIGLYDAMEGVVETVTVSSVLDDGIARAKKRMAETRAAYEEQKKQKIF